MQARTSSVTMRYALSLRKSYGLPSWKKKWRKRTVSSKWFQYWTKATSKVSKHQVKIQSEGASKELRLQRRALIYLLRWVIWTTWILTVLIVSIKGDLWRREGRIVVHRDLCCSISRCLRRLLCLFSSNRKILWTTKCLRRNIFPLLERIFLRTFKKMLRSMSKRSLSLSNRLLPNLVTIILSWKEGKSMI